MHPIHPLPVLRTLALTALGAMTCLAAHAAPWVLVTEQEALAARAAPEPMRAKAVPAPDSPRINLLLPNIASPVASPTRIQLKFEPTAPARIRPESFKVRYGAFRLDITSRIMATSQVTPEGIDVAEAALPKGSHRLFVEIQDSQGRTSERQLQFVVE